MRRYLAIILLIATLLCITSCKKEEEGRTINADTTFVGKVEEYRVDGLSYAIKYLLKTNEDFYIYADKNLKVVKIDPVNDEGKAILDKIDTENITVNELINKIIKEAINDGYLKEENHIDINIETKIESGLDICESCQGEGIIKCPECDGKKEIPCEGCLGYGAIKCPRCLGDGEITEGGNKETCPECQGGGFFVCPECAGKGHFICDCELNGYITCPSCGGCGVSE